MTGTTHAVRASVLIDGRFEAGAVVEFEAGRILRAGTGFEPAMGVEDFPGCSLVPGFLDTHVHGALGHDFSDDDPASVALIASRLLSRGTTGFMATILSSGRRGLGRSMENLNRFASAHPAGSSLLGVHFEGPFLNVERRGAHAPGELLPPALEVAQSYIESAPPGGAKSFTLAPELPGALELIDQLVSRGVLVALGHSRASYEIARQAIARGARHATHLFNGMGPLHHREPGLVGAILDSKETTMELIPDGIHVHPALLRIVAAACGSGRLVGVTDAAPVAGLPPGRHSWRGAEMSVRAKGGAYLEGGVLAGSVVDVPAALRTLTGAGFSLAEAVSMFTSQPAALLGCRSERGSLAPGRRADLVVLGPDLEPRRVYLEGVPFEGTPGRSPAPPKAGDTPSRPAKVRATRGGNAS